MGDGASLASDIWALGVILFKMVTGNIPFVGTNPGSVYAQIMSRKFNWPEGFRETMDANCRNLIERLLMLEPEDRLGCPGTKRNI
jgi:serine/threonine protein kinase